jgi:galactokinase
MNPPANPQMDQSCERASAFAAGRAFQGIYGTPARVYRAPGRVNLIGEHTDYNLGFVMPAAINLYCWVALSPRPDRQLHVCSANFEATLSVDLDDPHLTPRGDWSDYVVGTAIALEQHGYKIPGANILVSGQVPMGSGLSSSAAIEVSTGYGLLDINNANIDRTQLALACRHAENEFVGARVGIMDQFVSSNGRAGHALMLDCRSLDARFLPISADVRLVVCNTGVRHQHAGGEYNVRRAQCDEGVRLLSSALRETQSLRDIDLANLEQHKHLLPELIYRRCRHVVTENDRVQRAAEALLLGDFALLGSLMAESHHSMRDDYEVSCAELDTMVEIASVQPGVIGARMTGGGFGGCTINLVRADEADAFKHSVAIEYQSRTNIYPDIYVLSASEGVLEVTAESLAA